MERGYNTGPMGLKDSGGFQLDPFETVEQLLADMKKAAVKRDMEKFESLSDSLAVFTRAYVTPTMPVNWRKYRLTPAETIVADLLLSKMGKFVQRSAFMDALYFNKHEEADQKIVDIFICKVRKKLANSPYRIETIYGRGWCMTESTGPLVTYGTNKRPKESIAA